MKTLVLYPSEFLPVTAVVNHTQKEGYLCTRTSEDKYTRLDSQILRNVYSIKQIGQQVVYLS